MKKRQKQEANNIAKERVEKLFEMAEAAAQTGDLKTADRYVAIAWDIKQKFRLKLSDYQKRLFCRKCKSFLLEGKTARFRTEEGKAVVKCLNCENIRKYPLKP